MSSQEPLHQDFPEYSAELGEPLNATLEHVPKLRAHRGIEKDSEYRNVGKGKGIDENTPNAFEFAARTDLYSSLEFDVRWTEDGISVIYHDREIGETGEEFIDELTYGELKEIELENGGKIHSLQESLNSLKNAIDNSTIDELRLEIKEPGENAKRSVEDYTEQYSHLMTQIEEKGLKESTVIHSFNPDVLKEFKGYGYDVSFAADSADEDALKIAKDIEADILTVPFSDKPTYHYLRKVEDEGLKTDIWGIDTEEELAQAFKLEPSYVSVEHPEMIRSVLDEL